MRDEKTSHIPEEWLVPTVSAEESVADSLGSYRLCFEVAAGGMATVYLALYEGALGFEKVVALKKIHKHLLRERQFVDMFFDEARIAAHIDHPFVCKVVDFGHAQDSYYLAMEYLVGEPISAVWEAFEGKPELAAAPDVPRIVARLIADLAEGLHAAHELTDEGEALNLVHRDVTPANLFVLYDGTVRVVDFGIAKAKNRITHTETGHVKGKYAYVSPEQLKMKPLDRRCDIWALGVVMWELLTGRRLFKRESPVDTIAAVTTDKIPKPSAIRPHIPAQLDLIVMKALSRRPEGRHRTARDLAIELDTFLATTGYAVPRAEVADWLQTLFPGSAARKRKLIELTRHGESAVPIEQLGEEPAANPLPATAQTTVFRAGPARARQSRPSRPRLRPVSSEPTAEIDMNEIEIVRDSRPSRVSGPRRPAEEEPTNVIAPKQTAAAAKGTRPDAPRDARDDDAKERALRIDDDEAPRRRSSAREPSRVPMIVAGVAVVAVGAVIASMVDSGRLFGSVEPVEPVAERPRDEGEAEARTEPTGVRGDEEESSEDRSDLAKLGKAAPEVWPPWAGRGENGESTPGQTGEVYLTTRGGWADVYIEGRKVGRTPQELRLPVGSHRIVLRPNGGDQERPMDVEVRAGRRVYLDVAVPRE